MQHWLWYSWTQFKTSEKYGPFDMNSKRQFSVLSNYSLLPQSGIKIFFLWGITILSHPCTISPIQTLWQSGFSIEDHSWWKLLFNHRWAVLRTGWIVLQWSPSIPELLQYIEILTKLHKSLEFLSYNLCKN